MSRPPAEEATGGTSATAGADDAAAEPGFPPITPDEIRDLSCGRQLLERHRRFLHDAFLSGVEPDALLRARRDFFDRLLQQLYARHGLNDEPDLILVAVGGYGRGELFPASDIDILLAARGEPFPATASARLTPFLAFLWDLKLDVGHAVRTFKETVLAARDDLSIKTNLLETHLIAGKPAVYAEFLAAVRGDPFWTPAKFLRCKLAERDTRCHRYRDTAFSIEPDVKNNPGGLRDLHAVTWVAGHYLRDGGLRLLAEWGILNPPEYAELQADRRFLCRLRLAIHCVSPGNRLTLDLQKSVAALLGYGQEGNAPVEAMMRDVFRTFRSVRELTAIAWQIETLKITGRIGDGYDEPLFLSDGTVRRGALLDLIDAQSLRDTPARILSLFLILGSRPEIRGLHFHALRALRDCRRPGHYLVELPRCRELFKQLLSTPSCSDLALPLMHETCMLAAYLPQWERIEGLTQFDMFHLFSVDEHSVRVLTNLRTLTRGKDPRFQLFRTAFRQLAAPTLLRTAALLHDLGKGRQGHHAEKGAADAVQFCELHGFTRYETELVVWLVAHHLQFSRTAQSSDISDPDVITAFARLVRDEEHLNQLYCLTVADTVATNDREWTSWKDSIYRQLYFAVREALRQGTPDAASSQQAAEKKQQALLAALPAWPRPHLTRYLAQFPAGYFLHYDVEELRWHTANILRFQAAPQRHPLILFAQLPDVGTEVLLYYRNSSPLVFGAVTTALTRKALNVLSAQMYLTHDNHALCTVILQNRHGRRLDHDRLQNVRAAVIAELDAPGELPAAPPGALPRKIFSVTTQVRFSAAPGSEHTRLEITALDTPGLLAKIGMTLGRSGCLITAARITTTGERADDFFTVTDVNGLPLDASRTAALGEALRRALADGPRPAEEHRA